VLLGIHQRLVDHMRRGGEGDSLLNRWGHAALLR
jgi:hypothetical protein